MRKLALAALCLTLVGCPADLKDALRQYGFMPVRPASSMWRPGTLVYIRSRDPLEVGFICTASQMMGPSWAPLESMTTNAELARASKRGITMAAQVQDIVSADAELQSIKSVKMLLRNVRVFELTDYDVQQAIRTPNNRCLAAMSRRRAQGFDVTLIAAAIQADITYSIAWQRSSKMDVQAKVAAVQNLSAKLGVDASSSNDKSIQASGLIWGVRDDAYLAWLFQPRSMPAVDRGSRIMDPADIKALELNLAGTEHRSWPSTPSAEDLPLPPAPTLGLPTAQDPGTTLAPIPPTAAAPALTVPTPDVPLDPGAPELAPPAAADPGPAPDTDPEPDDNADDAPAEGAPLPTTQEEWDAFIAGQG